MGVTKRSLNHTESAATEAKWEVSPEMATGHMEGNPPWKDGVCCAKSKFKVRKRQRINNGITRKWLCFARRSLSSSRMRLNSGRRVSKFVGIQWTSEKAELSSRKRRLLDFDFVQCLCFSANIFADTGVYWYETIKKISVRRNYKLKLCTFCKLKKNRKLGVQNPNALGWWRRPQAWQGKLNIRKIYLININTRFWFDWNTIILISLKSIRKVNFVASNL